MNRIQIENLIALQLQRRRPTNQNRLQTVVSGIITDLIVTSVLTEEEGDDIERKLDNKFKTYDQFQEWLKGQ